MTDRYDEQTLLAYVEGDLPEAQAHAFKLQMLKDAALRNLVEQMEADRAALRSMPMEEPPADLMDRVQQHLERRMLLGNGEQENERQASQRRLRFIRMGTYLALAAMFVLGVGLLYLAMIDFRAEPAPAESRGLVALNQVQQQDKETAKLKSNLADADKALNEPAERERLALGGRKAGGDRVDALVEDRAGAMRSTDGAAPAPRMEAEAPRTMEKDEKAAEIQTMQRAIGTSSGALTGSAAMQGEEPAAAPSAPSAMPASPPASLAMSAGKPAAAATSGRPFVNMLLITDDVNRSLSDIAVWALRNNVELRSAADDLRPGVVEPPTQVQYVTLRIKPQKFRELLEHLRGDKRAETRLAQSPNQTAATALGKRAADLRYAETKRDAWKPAAEVMTATTQPTDAQSLQRARYAVDDEGFMIVPVAIRPRTLPGTPGSTEEPATTQPAP